MQIVGFLTPGLIFEIIERQFLSNPLHKNLCWECSSELPRWGDSNEQPYQRFLERRKVILKLWSDIIKWAASWENQQSAYAKTKTQISFAVTAKLISTFVFATWIVLYLYFLNTKFKASSHLQWLHSLVCVRRGQNPHCWFSRVAAQICTFSLHLAKNDLLKHFWSMFVSCIGICICHLSNASCIADVNSWWLYPFFLHTI